MRLVRDSSDGAPLREFGCDGQSRSRDLFSESFMKSVCRIAFSSPNHGAAANPAGTSQLQSNVLVRRVAELGSLGHLPHHEREHHHHTVAR